MKKSTSNSTEKGFSLLEAVLALGVASFVLTATYGAFTGGLKNLRKSNTRLEMVLFAESKLTDLEFVRLEESTNSGISPDGYQWNQQITLYTEDVTGEGSLLLPFNDEFDIYRITFSVRSESGAPVILEKIQRQARNV